MSQKCQTLPDIHFAEFDPKFQPPFNINDSIPFSCKNGFTYSSSYNIFQNPWATCRLKKGVATWIYDTGACKSIIKCPDLNIPDNGFITYTSANNVMSKAHYKCNKRYRLIGNDVRTCTAMGTWDGTDPVCERITCPNPGVYLNGSITPIKNIYYEGDEISYFCPFTNQIFKTQCINGNWNQNPPPCNLQNQPSTKPFQTQPSTVSSQIQPPFLTQPLHKPNTITNLKKSKSNISTFFIYISVILMAISIIYITFMMKNQYFLVRNKYNFK